MIEDLKSLREKYVGARLADVGPGAYEPSFTVQDSDWNEFTYDLCLEVGEDGRIQSIDEPYCQRLIGDDAMRSSYEKEEMGSLDYMRVDEWLEEQIEEEDE